MRTSTRLVLGFWAAGLLYGFLRYQAAIPVWGCPFKDLTALPCPTCGGTRALAALGRLDLREALLCNPLVTAVWLTTPVMAVLWERKPKLLATVLERVGLIPALLTAVLTVLINWIFLISLRHV